MAYRGRQRSVEGVDLAGLERPLDSVERLVPAWSRPPWADEWEDAWVGAVQGERRRGCVVCPVRGL